ncbi:hypothetical protein AOCH_006381 [Aspergillus ochraceoroseus]|uniref:Cytochrome P450 n=1 Tax=Aspergillus ochraceoroseus TaxID=138278 RepID=A0A0F8UI80_9EURO|nr:hypothetical protein AOCH_006381 [Aspergillus ochraceoroseus]
MSAILPQDINKTLVPLPLGASAYHQDPLLYIDRQSRHIQRNLQILIDAQSEGLLAGLSNQPLEESTSNGSYASTPGSVSPRGASTLPIRQPPPKKIGLRAAREGIFKSIFDLLKLREEEQEILSFRVDERENALKDVNAFTAKRVGLEKAISTIHENRQSQRTRELREEASTLETEIHELETRLSQMKARHQHVIQEVSQIENTVESKLSSYKASLSLLESDVRKFLSSPPVKPQATHADRETFYNLKSSRRTLDMAQEHWKQEQSELRRRQQEVNAEIHALEEGGGVWKQVIGDISGFERRLKAAMRQSLQNQSQLLEPHGPSGSHREDELVRTIMEDLGQTTEHVENQLAFAEERDWKLLVCCISAELQALREAREMLLNVFNATEEGKAAHDSSRDRINHDSPTDPLGVDNPEPPIDLLRDLERHSRATGHRSEDEDDEPDPAWLLSDSYLYFHPLFKVPSPKLAACSSLWLAYHTYIGGDECTTVFNLQCSAEPRTTSTSTSTWPAPDVIDAIYIIRGGFVARLRRDAKDKSRAPAWTLHRSSCTETRTVFPGSREFEFKPERGLNARDGTLANFMAFGKGTRACIARNLGMTELMSECCAGWRFEGG